MFKLYVLILCKHRTFTEQIPFSLFIFTLLNVKAEKYIFSSWCKCSFNMNEPRDQI